MNILDEAKKLVKKWNQGQEERSSYLSGKYDGLTEFLNLLAERQKELDNDNIDEREEERQDV